MNILITGGLGFIGRTLTRRFLAQGGHHITLIDKLSPQVHGADPDISEFDNNPNVTCIVADICTPGVLQDALDGVDAVYHFAAETGTGQSMYEVQQYYQTNVTGTAILLEEMVKDETKRPKTLALASSRSIYGEGAYVRSDAADPQTAPRLYPDARKNEDMDAGRFEFDQGGVPLHPVATQETDPTEPKSLYAASKLAQEHMCQIACDSIGVDYVALRLQNVYGPGQSLKNPYTGILSIFTNILRQGGTIDIFEDGLESRDFVYVEDVAEAFERSLSLPADAPRILNVGSGVATTVNELVALLEDKMNRKGHSKISGRFRPGDIRHNFADISRLQAHMGFTPAMDLKTGLSNTVDWALEQPVEEDKSAKANAELKKFLKANT